MILTDGEILEEIEKGNIVIEPFDRNCLGSNSYDVHLGSTLAVYVDDVLDAKKDNPIRYIEIPDEGYVLQPGEFYLGVTQEYTETHKHVPWLDGKSSGGRLGLMIHFTAGRGDIGFSNRWTLEIMVQKPVRVYKGMPIGQLTYFGANTDKMLVSYDKKADAKYCQVETRPVASKMYKNKF